MLDLAYPIDRLRGADYNPRAISDKDLARLQDSVRQLGVVKPIIARNDLIVAGHQRTRALRAMGATTAPVFHLSQSTTTYDEVRFNQLHNGTDLDCGDEDARIQADLTGLSGYTTVAPTDISANMRGRQAPVRHQIAELILKYGSWGGCVATQDGTIIHAAQYAIAARMVGAPLTTYVIGDEQREAAVRYLSAVYGRFSYDGIERQTYIQTLAQMHRLNDGGKKSNKSLLYESMVIPWLRENPKARGLDFGSGWGAYAKRLRGQGYEILDVELFRRAAGRNAIDVGAVHRMIDRMEAAVRAHGRFDFIVLDSVLNSIDCAEAEQAVMRTINALARPGAVLFFSGRKRERLDSVARFTKVGGSQRTVEFPDADGMTALYRAGHWFFQKFHTAEQVAALAADYGLAIQRHVRTASSTSWQVMATKDRDVPLQEAIAAARYEFNLPVSKSRTIERGDLIAALYSEIMI